MENFDQYRHETFDAGEVFDQFTHPSLSSDLTDRIVGAMCAEHRRLDWYRRIYKFSFAAVAALIIIVGALSISRTMPVATEVSAPTTVTVVTDSNDDLIAWVESEQAWEYKLFGDLDFESLTSAQTQAATEAIGEWEELFLEVIDG